MLASVPKKLHSTRARTVPPKARTTRRAYSVMNFAKAKAQSLFGKKADASEKVEADSIVFKIYRYSSEDVHQRAPYLQVYELPKSRSGPMVLDALLKIKNEIDPTLSFRRSCREGICGSCAMNVDGTNTLACLKPTEEAVQDGVIKIYPLPHMPVVRDLVTDLTQFYKHHALIRPWLEPGDKPRFNGKEVLQSEAQRSELNGLYECILCACCQTSCPSYWWSGSIDGDYLGPAVLLQAYRWIHDSRTSDEDLAKRIAQLTESNYDLYKCHTIMNCTQTCPKGLNPGKAIQKLKLRVNKHPHTIPGAVMAAVSATPRAPGEGEWDEGEAVPNA